MKVSVGCASTLLALAIIRETLLAMYRHCKSLLNVAGDDPVLYHASQTQFQFSFSGLPWPSVFDSQSYPTLETQVVWPISLSLWHRET